MGLSSRFAALAVVAGLSLLWGCGEGEGGTPAQGNQPIMQAGTAAPITTGGTGAVPAAGTTTVASGGANAAGGTLAPPSGGTGSPTEQTGGGGAGPMGGMPEQPPPASACSGKPGAQRGKSNQMLMAGGANRSFVYYAPENLDPNTPAPLVIVPHGFTMSGQAMYEITGYDKIADREGFVVAYPDGAGVAPWNVGTGICGAGAAVAGTSNDQAFIDAMIDFVDADRCLDRAHIFISGFSMGGYFSNETGCTNSKVKGIGPHSGGSHDLGSCANTRMPAIILHGDADPLITFNCGSEARDRWAARNGCMPASAGVDMRMVQGGHCEYSMGCPDGGQVAMCVFTGMGHGWAGGTIGTSPGANFAFPDFESGSELGWSFFKEFAW